MDLIIYKEKKMMKEWKENDRCFMSEDMNAEKKRSKDGLIGILGYVESKGSKRPAVLWFKEGSEDFVKGELYFPEIDKTYEELIHAAKYDLDAFEPTDTEGWCMEGTVIYKGTEYGVYVSAYNDTISWDEEVAVSLAQKLSGKAS